jgi:SAM-dependent methyltransferase
MPLSGTENGHERDQMSVVTEDPADIPVRRRRERLLGFLDVTVGRGLEVGPLYSPLVLKGEADVRYVDVQDTSALRAYYESDGSVPVERIVDVDVALYADGRLRSIAGATADLGRFDWVVASHVVEHVPDLIGWLADLADVLADDGRLALVVPDRRYCMDACRHASTVGEILLAHESRDQRPSVRAVYDYFSEAVAVTAHDAWRGARPGPADRLYDDSRVRAELARHQNTDEYIDCHVWTFTPADFVERLATLASLGLLDFVVDDVLSTPVSDLEFYVVLRRLPRTLSAESREDSFRTGFIAPPDDVLVEPAPSSAAADLPASAAGVADLPPGVSLQAITPKEWLLVRGKRRVLGGARALLDRARRLS